jgi:putative addiction module killer protein
VYFTRVGMTIVLLLCGGGKSNQSRDIEEALEMARILKE